MDSDSRLVIALLLLTNTSTKTQKMELYLAFPYFLVSLNPRPPKQTQIFYGNVTLWCYVSFVVLVFMFSLVFENMWKYVVVICTILAAVITPSTDPVTQLLMSSALLTLYLGGSGFVILLTK